MTFTIAHDEHGLMLRRRPDTVIRLQPAGVDAFLAGSLGRITFHRDADSRNRRNFAVTQDRVWDLRFRRALRAVGGTDSARADEACGDCRGRSSEMGLLRGTCLTPWIGTAALAVTLTAQTAIAPPPNKYSPADDVKLGREAAQQVEKEMPVMRDDNVNSYLTAIGRRLVDAIPPSSGTRSSGTASPA